MLNTDSNFDGIAEEIQDASLTLPKAIIWSAILNAILGFLMAVTLIFTLGDIGNILATKTLQPFIQVFFNATQSYGGTNAMTAIVIILLVSCCISEVATASRQIWSFARDRGLPASGWLSQVICRLMRSNLTNMIGHPWLEYSTSCSLCFPRRQLIACLHQSRLIDGFKRYQLSWRCFDSFVIFHHHQLSCLAKNLGTSAPSTKMVTWKIRAGR